MYKSLVFGDELTRKKLREEAEEAPTLLTAAEDAQAARNPYGHLAREEQAREQIS